MSMSLRKITHALYLTLMKVAVNFSPPVRHRAFVGSGSAAQLCRHIARTGAKKVLVVTDGPLRELGVADRAVAGLHDT